MLNIIKRRKRNVKKVLMVKNYYRCSKKKLKLKIFTMLR